jgi:hypothetical protein
MPNPAITSEQTTRRRSTSLGGRAGETHREQSRQGAPVRPDRARRPAADADPADRAAGLRWPAGEQFRTGKDCFGLDQVQVRLYTAIARHTVLAMAALAICAITAALLRPGTDTRASPPVRPGQPGPADPGMIAMTVPEVARLLSQPAPPGQTVYWLG